MHLVMFPVKVDGDGVHGCGEDPRRYTTESADMAGGMQSRDREKPVGVLARCLWANAQLWWRAKE